jgi:hypothetical protein
MTDPHLKEIRQVTPNATKHFHTSRQASEKMRLSQNSGSASPASIAPGDDEHNSVIHDLHYGDRDCIRGKRQAERTTVSDACPQQRYQG